MFSRAGRSTVADNIGKVLRKDEYSVLPTATGWLVDIPVLSGGLIDVADGAAVGWLTDNSPCRLPFLFAQVLGLFLPG